MVRHHILSSSEDELAYELCETKSNGKMPVKAFSMRKDNCRIVTIYSQVTLLNILITRHIFNNVTGFDLLKADQDSGFWITESLHRGMRDTENIHRDYGIKRKFGSRLKNPIEDPR